MTACAADTVLLIGDKQAPDNEPFRTVAEFYGVKFEALDPANNTGIYARIADREIMAVLISEQSLSRLDRERLMTALRRPAGRNLPVLVFGIQNNTAPQDLAAWSGGMVRDCAPSTASRAKIVRVTSDTELTRTLAGTELPAVASPACRMEFEANGIGQVILSSSADGAMQIPVLLRTRSAAGDLFFMPRMDAFDTSWIGQPNNLPKAFSYLSPAVLFTAYAVGDHGWHSQGRYANLTIDDPWLTEPYGHLNYRAVLAEMETHNFHTTLAFVPWNFDRSKPDVVAIFREHPERFSISVHGNNHAHREFGDYRENSLEQQTADIRQGIARMERFHALTGIPYDRVMVFPHTIAPGPTLDALKKYGFLATANFSNIPAGAAPPNDPAFLLRPCTTVYGGLVNCYRYSAGGEILKVELAIHSFLGNPLLFYSHESLFDSGAGAFNSYADYVNRLQPGTRWAGLGEIARHSHLVRLRDDGAFDVRMLSDEMELSNPASEARDFYIQREIDPDAASLAIDGSSHPLTVTGSVSTLRITIPAGETQLIRVERRNGFDPSREEIRKSGVRIYALRMLSDFRDLWLVRSGWGRAVTRAYYDHQWDALELYAEKNWWIPVLLVAAVIGVLRLRRRVKTQGARSAHG